MKFLELHKQLLKEGVPSFNNSAGLCFIMEGDKIIWENEHFQLLIPDLEDSKHLREQGYREGFWGSLKTGKEAEMDTEYNGLRQNVILLCAALNNEDLDSFE